MTEKGYAVLFALLTALFWGLYGPALQTSRVQGPQETVFKPFVLIGLAYLLIGVFGGLVGNKVLGGSFQFQQTTITWGFIAGALGAFGALTLTLAIYTGGGPKIASLVMPIVFGGATIIAVLTTLIMKNQLSHAHPMQFVGSLAIVLGVVLVQAYASHGPAPKPAAGEAAPTAAPPASASH